MSKMVTPIVVVVLGALVVLGAIYSARSAGAPITSAASPVSPSDQYERVMDIDTSKFDALRRSLVALVSATDASVSQDRYTELLGNVRSQRYLLSDKPLNDDEVTLSRAYDACIEEYDGAAILWRSRFVMWSKEVDLIGGEGRDAFLLLNRDALSVLKRYDKFGGLPLYQPLLSGHRYMYARWPNVLTFAWLQAYNHFLITERIFTSKKYTDDDIGYVVDPVTKTTLRLPTLEERLAKQSQSR